MSEHHKLWGAVAKRSEQRLSDLYWRHAGDAVRLAFLLTGDHHAAEDIVQDAFVRLFSRFQELRSPDAFEIYLRRTVVNLSQDRFRRLKLERDQATKANTPRQAEVTSRLEDRELIRQRFTELAASPASGARFALLRRSIGTTDRRSAVLRGCGEILGISSDRFLEGTYER